MMHRTTVLLPSSLRGKANHLAHQLGVSLGELIRGSLCEKLEHSRQSHPKPDIFFADQNFFTGETPADLAVHHDQYLYGEDA